MNMCVCVAKDKKTEPQSYESYFTQGPQVMDFFTLKFCCEPYQQRQAIKNTVSLPVN